MTVPRLISRFAVIFCVVCALMIVLAAFVQAASHLHDLAGIGHIAGIWMALAQSSRAGVFYPPLEADGVYAGTRYMPLCFELIAGLVPVVGDYVVAAKLMALGSVTTLLAGVFLAVRRITGRSTEAFIAAGLVLASPEGWHALLSPHADALAVALTLVGLLLIERDDSPLWTSWVSAFFFTVAVAAKFSAVAGPAAVLIFLGRSQPRRALRGFLPWMGMTALLLVLLDAFSAGRFIDNFRSLGSGGMSLESVRIGPARIAFALSQTLPFTLLLPVAFIARWRRSGGSGRSLWDWYFLLSAATTALTFTSPGTGLNHLLELEVAAVLALSQLFTHQSQVEPARPSSLTPLARLLVLTVLLMAGHGVIRTWSAPSDPAAIPSDLLGATLPADARILAEDATVPVLLGQRPVVMDAFAYRVLAERGRVDDRHLAGRIDRQEFDALVLLGRVDRPGESLCPRFHFGPRVTHSMQQAYRFQRQIGPYYVFVPPGAEQPDTLSFTLPSVD
jgi:hypothetical protein